jgi:hypothetical protein
MTATLSDRQKARLVDALCRLDFASFIAKVFHTLMPNSPLQMNFHIYALAFYLEPVRLGVIRRLIINISPRSLKSIVTSLAFPAFVFGHEPSKRVIVASYNLDLATKLHNDFRAILKSSWYQRIFPHARIVKDTESEVVTTKNGFRLATSIDGPLTGRGGDIVIIDDPLSAIDALSDSKRQHVNDWYNANFRCA